MDNCLFCRIVRREIPAQIVYEDEQVLAFKDIQPAAPVHILVIPKKHYAGLAAVPDSEMAVMGQIGAAANRIAREQGIAETGYRLINNCGADAGQVIFHLHFHLLGGRALGPLVAKEV